MQVKTVQHGCGERGRAAPSPANWPAGPRRCPRRSWPPTAHRTCGRSAGARAGRPRTASARPTSVEGHRAGAVHRQLGRPGPAHARQLRGLRARGVAGEMAGGARRRALGELLHRLRHRPAEALLRPLPQGRGHRLGRQPRACSCRCGTSTGSSSAHENEWPLARTQWTKFYLDPTDMQPAHHRAEAGGRLEYEAMGDGLTFLSPRRCERMEFTGPSPLRWCLSSTTDADLFAVLRVFDPRAGGHVPGRAGSAHAHRPRLAARLAPQARCPARSLPYRPFHTHDEVQPLSSPAAGGRWTSRSGPPPSSCRRATASACRCAARTTSTTAKRPTCRT
jgi:hypothetical protein